MAQVTAPFRTHELPAETNGLSICFISDLMRYRDNSSIGGRHLAIDLSILKNAVEPMSEQRRRELRAKHRISEERPSITVGFADRDYGDIIPKLINAIEASDVDADWYLVNSTCRDWLQGTGIHHINEYGVLRELYAATDAALMGSNLCQRKAHLHNFVEASEGGPLFLIRPRRQRQFGYRQLKQKNVIREFLDIGDLIESMRAYLLAPARDEHAATRASHLLHTRERYLSHIGRCIEAILHDEPLPMHQTNLCITASLYGNVRQIEIQHPETRWDSYLSLPKLPRIHRRACRAVTRYLTRIRGWRKRPDESIVTALKV